MGTKIGPRRKRGKNRSDIERGQVKKERRERREWARWKREQGTKKKRGKK